MPRPRLTGARVSGCPDLAGAQITHALWLEACWFEEAVNLLGASTQILVFTDSRIPGIEADSARIEGNFSLRRSVVEGGAPTSFNRVKTALSLTDARVGGGLLLNGTELNAPALIAMHLQAVDLDSAASGNVRPVDHGS